MKTFPAASLKKQLPGCELTLPTKSGLVTCGVSGELVALHPAIVAQATTTKPTTLIQQAP